VECGKAKAHHTRRYASPSACRSSHATRRKPLLSAQNGIRGELAAGDRDPPRRFIPLKLPAAIIREFASSPSAAERPGLRSIVGRRSRIRHSMNVPNEAKYLRGMKPQRTQTQVRLAAWHASRCPTPRPQVSTTKSWAPAKTCVLMPYQSGHSRAMAPTAPRPPWDCSPRRTTSYPCAPRDTRSGPLPRPASSR
jgi:hypothetical protein